MVLTEGGGASDGAGHGCIAASGPSDDGIVLGAGRGRGQSAVNSGQGRGRGRGRGSGLPLGGGGAPSMAPASTGSSRTTPKKKRYKNIDLKSFFSSNSSSGSGSGPSTHESVNTLVSVDNEVQGGSGAAELGNANQQVVQSTVAEMAIGEEQSTEAQDEDVELIKVFNPDIHLVSDPGLRISIDAFHPNIRDNVKRAYLMKGPTQPFGHNFPRTRDNRSFSESWFAKYDWLEYSVAKDASYCFYCFLFRQEPLDEKFGHDAFTKLGYRNWKNAYHGLPLHVGGAVSCHNRARTVCDDFKNQRASITHKVDTKEKSAEVLYDIRLTTSLAITCFLISQGLAFRGHDESDSSKNKGNFLEMLEWYKKRNEEARVAFEELCPINAQMTSHHIQKDLTEACAIEVKKVIKEEIGDKLFTVLIDESRDISIAEQMAVIVRFVNNKGMVVERFLGLKHVADTTSNALKKALLEMLGSYGLSVSRLRGQGYDGASNMRGEFNGLQKQIRDENPHAFYVHCFAHQLQLVIVSVASCCSSFSDFFNYVGLIVTSASSSCRRKDKLIAKHRSTVLEKLESGEIFSGKGKHQSTNLARPGDTRWGSHFTTLLRIESMWDSVINVLSMIHDDERNPGRAGGLVHKMESFSFVFNMKLMLKVLRITNELSLLLQRKDQNIVQAMSLLIDVKTRLVNLRNDGWEPLFEEVKLYCVAKHIPIPNMDEEVPRWGRSRLGGNLITQGHHYRVDTFFAALDAIITELDHRFNEVSSELLVCISCLDPRDSFSKFNIDKIARLTEIYDQDFSIVDRTIIKDQLETFILHARRVDDFVACHDLGSFAIKMVQTEKHLAFPLVYRLIELALLLPVATASVERAFSSMNIIKTDLRNKMSDDWLNDLLMCYIEKDIFRSIECDKVKKTFQAMKNRKRQLPKPPRRPRHT